jgi:transcription-repair coupling factor (superfamily II helicase)
MDSPANSIEKLLSWLTGKKKDFPHAVVQGFKGSFPSLVLSLFKKRTGRMLIIVAPDDQALKVSIECREYLKFSGSGNPSVNLFQARDFLPDSISYSPFSEMERIKTLYRLAGSDADAVIISATGLLEKVVSGEFLQKLAFRMDWAENIKRDDLICRLHNLGYDREFTVEEPGQFSVRGGIIDIFSPLYDLPARLDFFGDTIESLRLFEPMTQRSSAEIEEYTVLPVSDYGVETDPAEKIMTGISSYFMHEAILAVIEPDAVKDDILSFREKINSMQDPVLIQNYSDPEAVLSEIRNADPIYFASGTTPDQLENSLNISFEGQRDIHSLFMQNIPGPASETSPRQQQMKMLAETARILSEDGYTVILMADSEFSCAGIMELLKSEKIPAQKTEGDVIFHVFEKNREFDKGIVNVVTGHVEKGFIFETYLIAVIPESEIAAPFGKKERRTHRIEHRTWDLNKSFVELIKEINAGDFIVHTDYGIGIYQGLVKLKFDEHINDFLHLEYRDSARVYIPVQKMDRIQKYIRTGDETPQLSRLGSRIWEKKKEEASQAAQELAERLLSLYAGRKTREGVAFSAPDGMFREFEASFPYELTSDQEKAIEEVISDMMNSSCMERLICGDVGFGKTEVAIRAAFKAVLDGKQVAILVPTTVLCEQHLMTFRQRFEKYPVTVESLSRLVRAGEQKKIIENLEKGAVDIVIGTHRLLVGDVKFRDLGLLIIDEEHRFGVSQKEKIREMKENVDTIMLSATPIPRTIHMALSGLKDMSIIASPPRDRLAVKTYMTRFNERIIREGILKELSRKGQVFFLHNRVETIEERTAYLSSLVPEAGISYAHGQMKPSKLERIMRSFVSREIDVLVCSSIIESGLDIPSVNTIFIERADQFGLAQLYQIRGRVGRSGEQAYAFFLMPEMDHMTDDAKKRISVLRRFSELSSGFALSMFDMEIRGSGDLLGKKQSGHINDVGYEMYVEMLENAVSKIKNPEKETKVELNPEIKIAADAFFPDDFIEDQHIRLLYYKKLACTRNENDADELRDELMDRFGTLPVPVSNLLKIGKIKQIAKNLLIQSVQIQDRMLHFQFDPSCSISFEDIQNLAEKSGKNFRISGNDTIICESIFPLSGESAVSFAVDTLKEIQACVNNT